MNFIVSIPYPIFSGYIIEMAEYGLDNWKTVPGFCPKEFFTAKGLTEGKKYVFRIRTENMYGASEPLDGKPVRKNFITRKNV